MFYIYKYIDSRFKKCIFEKLLFHIFILRLEIENIVGISGILYYCLLTMIQPLKLIDRLNFGS